MTSEVKQLDDEQLETFDTDYVRGERWDAMCRFLDNAIQELETVRILDIGGGNGQFADQLLERYDTIEVTVLDNAEVLLAKNTEHPRKTVRLGSAADLGSLFDGESFEVVTINWVLHHLVVDGYAPTAEVVKATLLGAKRVLIPSGHLSVFENLYEGYIVDSAPSRLIFGLTSLSSERFADVLGRLGANTAGVGVCFRSDVAWRSLFADAGFALGQRTICDTLPVSKAKRIALHLRPVSVVHYVFRCR